MKAPPPELLTVPPTILTMSVPPTELVLPRLFRIPPAFTMKSGLPEPKFDTVPPDKLSSALSVMVLYWLLLIVPVNVLAPVTLKSLPRLLLPLPVKVTLVRLAPFN